jgi:hypothetical protein
MEMMCGNHATHWYRARCLESLVQGFNGFLNQFGEIPRRSIIVCSLSLSAKASLNLSPFEISCSCPLSQDTVYETTLQYHFLNLWLS